MKIRALQMWAKQHAEAYPEGREREVAYTAFIDGFRLGRDRAANFLDSFQHHKESGISILIRGIGQSEIEVEPS